MEGKRLVLAAIALIVPAAGAKLAYHITGDPYFQPLGLTQERLAEFNQQSEFLAIGIHVAWGRDRTSEVTQADLRELIASVVHRRTDDYYIRFHDAPGRDVEITLVVGPNRYGPYPPARFVDGIEPAVVALRATRQARQ